MRTADAAKVPVMEWWTGRLARAWLLYLLPGVLWVTLGTVLFGDTQGDGAHFHRSCVHCFGRHRGGLAYAARLWA